VHIALGAVAFIATVDLGLYVRCVLGNGVEPASVDRLVMWRSKPSSQRQKEPKEPDAT
jgi:hypothetical protein